MTQVVNIFGDGLAGLTASYILVKNGFGVKNFYRKKSEKNHIKHIHLLKHSILEIIKSLEEDLYLRIMSCVEGDWLLNKDHKHSRIGIECVIEAMMDVLHVSGDYNLEESPSLYDLEINDSELYIDATGGQRQLVRSLDRRGLGELSIDEAGSRKVYITKSYAVDSDIKELLIWHDEEHRVIVEIEKKLLKITTTISNDARLENVLKHGLGLSVPTKNPMGVWITQSPNIRMASFESERNVLMFGDSLIQLPARTGFGVASIFDQAVILNSNDFETSKKKLHQYADSLWMGSVFQESLFGS
jgi:hypothetical protein